jgi:hypothetical protein
MVGTNFPRMTYTDITDNSSYEVQPQDIETGLDFGTNNDLDLGGFNFG